MSESLCFQKDRNKDPYRVYKLVVSCFLEFAKIGHYRKRFRALTGLDTFSRESLAIYMDKSIKGEQVCDELEKLKAARGLPQRIKVDNGTEFISRELDAWACFNKIKLDFSRLGKPTNNPHIEAFNGSVRDECLYLNRFMSLEDARGKVERWRRDYNEFRPHSAYNLLFLELFIHHSGVMSVCLSPKAIVRIVLGRIH
jgi:transposase InsO family protein